MTATTTIAPLPTEPGETRIVEGLPIDEYHGGAGASKSALDDFRKHPLLYWSNRFDPTKPPEEEKVSHLQGNLMHCAFLEPDFFQHRYVTVPDDAPRKPTSVQRNAKKPADETITAINWWDRFLLDNADKKIITPDAYTLAWKQADSLRKIKSIRDLVARGRPEVSAYWTDPITGLYCRCRPDWVSSFGSTGDILLDAKGVGDSRADVFGRVQAHRMRYHVQDAYYSNGWYAASGRPVLGFIFAIVEDTWPFLANAVELDEPSKAQGHKEFREDLGGIKRHFDSGIWTPNTDTVAVASLPAYAFTED